MPEAEQDWRTVIGRLIRERRVALDLTQEELTDRLPIAHQGSVSRWESGQVRLDLAQLRDVEDALELDRGTLAQLAGFVEPAESTRQAIERDPRLTAPLRRLMLTVYDEAVRAADIPPAR